MNEKLQQMKADWKIVRTKLSETLLENAFNSDDEDILVGLAAIRIADRALEMADEMDQKLDKILMHLESKKD